MSDTIDTSADAVRALVAETAWGSVEIEQACATLLAVQEERDDLRASRKGWIDEADKLRAEAEEARREMVQALALVARVREAIGDHGKRMQDELIDYCRELAAAQAQADDLRARLEDVAGAFGRIRAMCGLADADAVAAEVGVERVMRQLTAAQAREARLREELAKCVSLLESLEPEIRGGYSPDGALATARAELANQPAGDQNASNSTQAIDAQKRDVVTTAPAAQAREKALREALEAVPPAWIGYADWRKSWDALAQSQEVGP